MIVERESLESKNLINIENTTNPNVQHNQTLDDSKNVGPNHTLYINNLNEKVKVDELKQSLYHLFSQFGDIIEIHARKSFRMKGQAFIIFRDVTSSSTARHALNGALLFGKPLRVDFSKNISDAILKNTKNYTHKDKVKLDQERRKRREQEYLEIRKKTSVQGVKLEKKVAKTFSESQNLPNNTLFVESLPQDITEPILRTVFSKYGGFREVRLFEGKGIAFVEYENEVNAGGALLGLNGLPLTSDCTLRISFAKK